MQRFASVVVLTVGLTCTVTGQGREQDGRVRLEVRTGADPVADAEVVANGATQLTDEHGVVVLVVAAGNVQVTVVREGFIPITVSVAVLAGQGARGQD